MINSYFNIFLIDFPEGVDNLEKNIEEIIEYFSEKYPNPETALNYETPFQLLVATIMSAQTTDCLERRRRCRELVSFPERPSPEAESGGAL